MTQKLTFRAAFITAFSVCSLSSAQTLLHYWNFNNNSTAAAIVQPTSTVGGASLSAVAGGTSTIDAAGGTGQNFNTLNLNARNGDSTGTHLRFNNPIGGALLFSLPTTGYSNIVVKFATRRSGSGAGEQIWSYSTDGTTFTKLNSVIPKDADPELITFDFTNISGVANNPNFKLKVEFAAGGGGTVGNNRFDNFTVDSGAAAASPSSVSVAKNFIKTSETAGTLKFLINVANPTAGSIDLVLKPASYNTADSGDFTFSKQTVQIVSGQTQYSVDIPIINDNAAEQQAEYFNVELQNPVNTQITGTALSTIYIIDDETKAPIPSKQISLNYLGSFDPSGTNSSSVEIVAYDKNTHRLFASSAITDVLDIIDYSNPAAPALIKSVNMAQYGGITSVAVKNGLVAVASPNTDPQQNGSVVFFDTDGNFLKQITVGALPDTVSFSPDGKTVMTANEGEPNAAYTVDPESSVSIIDISGGVANINQNSAVTLDFTKFNSQEAQLMAAGVRKLMKSSTLSQDIEPEYISISEDNSRAYVTLQENNAIAEVNLQTKNIEKIWPLGTKDMSKPGNGFDASDNNGEILIANWPVKSFYIPDALQTYTVGGVPYIITANEGDEKEFNALNERVGVSAMALDPTIFPQADMLKQNYNLGRFRATNNNGNLDADTDFEEINSVGARSFSIFNAQTGQQVFDSGDQFERYTAANYAAVFNSDHETNSPKSRSRAKGPEPEGVALATIGGQKFAFITLERVGGVMVYNVTNPASPVFADYKNPRMTTSYGGDNGPEGVIFIPASDTATGKTYVVVGNEISGTISTYELDSTSLGTAETTVSKATFNIFPNPVNRGGSVYFNRKADFQIFDMSGRQILAGKNATEFRTESLQPGLFIVKTTEGTAKLIVK